MTITSGTNKHLFLLDLIRAAYPEPLHLWTMVERIWPLQKTRRVVNPQHSIQQLVVLANRWLQGSGERIAYAGNGRYVYLKPGDTPPTIPKALRPVTRKSRARAVMPTFGPGMTERNNEVAEMYRQGIKMRAITYRFRISDDTLISIAKTHGLPLRRKKARGTIRVSKEALQMFAEAMEALDGRDGSDDNS